jgi:hypothetical protein
VKRLSVSFAGMALKITRSNRDGLSTPTSPHKAWMYSPLYCSSSHVWISSSMLRNHVAIMTCVTFPGVGLTSADSRSCKGAINRSFEDTVLLYRFGHVYACDEMIPDPIEYHTVCLKTKYFFLTTTFSKLKSLKTKFLFGPTTSLFPNRS